jgi:hypothetical protein
LPGTCVGALDTLKLCPVKHTGLYWCGSCGICTVFP